MNGAADGDAATQAPLISLRDVARVFQRGDVPVKALDGISLDIRAGEFVAIMGASGSGKSTLMNMIGLLDRPTSGSYLFDGEEVADFDDDRRAVLRREAFGFVFQTPTLLPWRTVTSPCRRSTPARAGPTGKGAPPSC